MMRLFGCLILVASLLPAQGGYMVPVSIEKLAETADWIVHGTITSKTCRSDSSSRIYTEIELETIEFWKGSWPQRTVRFLQGGGTLGQRRSVIPGQAQFGIGEEVVVFLGANQEGAPLVLGLAQGKFQVWKNKISGRKMAASIFHGLPEQTGSSLAPQSGLPKAPLALAELKERVKGRKQDAE